MVHWYLLWSGQEFQDLTKIWPNFLTTHHWCLTCSQWVCSLWKVVRPWSWPQPAYCNTHWGIQWPHTIMVHWYLLWSGQEFQDLTKIWPNFLTTHHWCLTCSQWVCSLWRVVWPWSWTQPAYCINHWWVQCLIPSWCTDIYSGHGENFRIWPKSVTSTVGHTVYLIYIPLSIYTITAKRPL